MKFRCAGITDSFIDGLEYSPTLAVFFQGCRFRCEKCQNAELQNFDGGIEIDTTNIINQLNKYNTFYRGLVLTGGNPTDQLDVLYDLISNTHLPKILYTGHYFEEIPCSILDKINIVIDGPYIENLKCINKFPASKNQRYFKKIDNIWIQQVLK